jgi:hypothetical protein
MEKKILKRTETIKKKADLRPTQLQLAYSVIPHPESMPAPPPLISVLDSFD